jgi:hypothetical protein
VSRTSIRQSLLGELPHALIWIEFGSVARESNEVDAANAPDEVLDQPSTVRPPAVPQDEDVTWEVT